MNRLISRTVPAFIGLGLGLASAAWAADLQILSMTPSGRTESETAVSAITATFNQPMVPMDAPGAMGSYCPIHIEPAVKGRCRWQGTQVLSFEPSERLKTATSYKVVIPAGTASKIRTASLPKDVEWEFETMRPEIVASRPTDSEHWIDLNPTLYVQFSLPMNSRKAAGSITLDESTLNGDGAQVRIPVAVRMTKAAEIKTVWPYYDYGVALSTATVLAIRPSRRLKPDHVYRLHLAEGLAPAEGNLGLLSEGIIQFETWYSFRAVEFPAKACLPSYPRMAFTNPVKYQDLLDHMSVLPSTPMPHLEPNEAAGTGIQDADKRRVYQGLPDIGYEPDRTYSFKVDKNLKDIFGNRLGSDVTFKLETDEYCPYIDVPTGFGILEAYLPPRQPVTLLNVSEAPIELKRIPDDEIIPFYNSVEWTSEDRKALKNPFKTQWQSHAKRNTRSRGYLDLNDVLHGQGGLVFSQVESRWQPDHPEPVWYKALDDVTRLGMTFKNSPDSTFFWISFLKTGGPAAHVPVEVRDDDNHLLWQGETDAQGFASGPGWKKLGLKEWPRYERPKLWALAKSPRGSAVLSVQWKEGVEPWRFNIPYDWSARTEHYEGSLFTERGVYRPGEKVYFKGIVRKLENGDWVPMDLHKLQIVLRDARNQEALKTTVAISTHSSFDLAYPLKDEAPTGIWTLEVTEPYKEKTEVARPVEGDEEEEHDYAGEQRKIQFGTSFRVEAFKPAAFEVHVTPEKPSYFIGDTFKAVVDGWYLFGAPMAGASVEWKLRLEPGSFAPPGYDEFDFSSGWWENNEKPEGQLLASASETLDSQGKKSVEARLNSEQAAGPMSAVLEASVLSPDRQRLFGRTYVTVHKTNLYLGLKPGQFFAEQGKNWSCDFVAVRPDGQPAAGLPVTGRLIRRDWLSVERAGVAGRLEWDSEQRETVVSTFTYVTTGSTYTWTYHVDAPGEYILKLTGQDEAKRETESAVSFYATGKGDSWWSRNDTDLIELTADKKSYKPGDQARILIKSPYTHTRALITLEREGVIDHWLTTLEGGASFITVPITDKHVPNVFVGVMLVQGRTGLDQYSAEGDDLAKPQAKFGYINLSVNPDGRKLAVRLQTDKTNYRPRDKVTIMLKTLDETGHGAPSEVTVYAVDEGVLALTGYATPDIFSDFYGERPLLVDTVDSRVHIIGQRSFGEKGENRGGGGGGGASLEGIDLRSRFVPTAYWNPSVETAADGSATVSFTMPDNLSRFRVMAVAHAGRRFGSGQVKFTVSKPLLLRPSLPRFARVGDTFEGGLVIHNYTSSAVNGTVGMQLAGTSIQAEGQNKRQIQVQAGKALEVTWTCKAVGLGKASFQFRAAAGGETDGLEWIIPVLPAERLEVTATSGVTEREAIEALSKPAGTIPDLGGLQMSLSPTALAGLQEGARFLLEYPYGCLEQKLSRSLPVIVGADLIAAFRLGTVGDLKTQVQSVMDHLADYQHPNGGFGYWPNPWMPDPYLTAYTLEVTHLAQHEGYKLPEPVISKAVSWLKTYLSTQQEWAYPYSESEDYCSRAYALYVLGLQGQAPSNYFTQLYQRRDQIPYCGKAYLLKAAPLVMNDPAIAQTLANELMNQGRYSPTTMHFEEPAETRMPWIHESTVQTTAQVLQALLEAKGGFPNDEKAVHWLIQERKDQGRWRTTQENAISLRALQDYYRRYEKTVPHFTATVSQLDKDKVTILWTQTFSTRTLESPVRDFSLQTLFKDADQTQLRFAKTGEGRLYYTLRMKYVPAKYDKPDFEGFEITKTVKPLYGSGKELTAGARAVVTLTVKTNQDRTFVALNDPLPGGFEIVDPTFNTESEEDTRKMQESTTQAPYWGSFQRNENYDDRIVIFADFLSAGEHSYSYLVQATTPGRFTSPATFIEGMYEPEVFGHTASGEADIKK